MKEKIKKLVLNKETVRSLQDSELSQVAGGQGGLPPAVEGQAGPHPIITGLLPHPNAVTGGCGLIECKVDPP
ncbi:MAG: class I lanthipeptide [Phycisphaerae bacterium]|nr:class I lanthipeptide [Phycisphaerae bacterium]